ncbi:MAG: Fe-S cluster assembly scaffold SufA [Mesorhizobium sp.]|jgi:iron-sulfur cluster assembly protein|nr:Fe-S cluster assembly scaffold SufA [Mesorhizobium sp.]
MGFAVMSMTDRAAERVREIVASRENAHGIRVGVKKGGCAGMEYTVDLVTAPNPKDDHVEHDGAHVYVAPEAALFLLGTEMDFEVTTLRTGFTFRNPNQSSACGCGESVELKPADLKALAEARAGAA